MTWKKWLNSLAGAQRGTRTARRIASPFRPGLEVLEGRVVPAGIVTAKLVGTVLTITGDAADNDISITNDTNNYGVAGNNGTTINGSTSFSVLAVGSISMVMNAGNDTVSINNAQSIPVSFTGGDGDDTLNMTGSQVTTLTFAGNAGNDKLAMTNVAGTTLSFSGGTDNDTLILDIGAFKSATFTGDAGNDTMTATDAAFNTPTSTLTFNGGTENDTLNLGRVAVRALAFNGNAGDDTLNIGSVAGNNMFSTITAIGDVGNNAVLIHNGFTRVAGLLRITNGTGATTETTLGTASDQIMLGSLSVTNSSTNDTFSAGGAALIVGGAVAINNGAGGSATAFSATLVNIGGLTTITNGTGNDIVQFGLVNVVNLGTINVHGVTINNGAGDSTTSFVAEQNTLTAPLSVTNTDGDDKFTASGDTFTVIGGVRLSNGNGINSTQFISASSVQVTGAVAITSLLGTDQTSIGVETTNATLGALTINNGSVGGPTTFNGKSTAISGALSITTGDVTVNSQMFSVGTSATIVGAGTVTFNSSIDLTIRGLLTITGGNVIFGGIGSNQLKSATISGHDVTFSGVTNVATTLTVKSSLGSVDNNSVLNILGSFTITGVQNASLDGAATFIGGNLSITTAAGINTVVAENLSVIGTTTINTSTSDTAAGGDQVDIDDSNFTGAVTIKLGAGDDLLNIETQDTDRQTSFYGTFLADLGDGADEATIGRGDGNDFVKGYDKVTILGPTSDLFQDKLHELNRGNIFFVLPIFDVDVID